MPRPLIGRYKVKKTTEQRFWEKVDKEGPIPEFAPELGPCWIWKGAAQRYGYGSFAIPTGAERGWRRCLAHRWSYENLIGPIPDDLPLDHLCRVPSCVRPDHLDPVPQRENQRRGMKGELRTHCKNGHEYTDENTYLNPQTGHRPCQICRRDAKKRTNARNRKH